MIDMGLGDESKEIGVSGNSGKRNWGWLQNNAERSQSRELIE
jgi:hypothetical protein